MSDFEIERENVGEGWQPLIERLNADLLAIDPDYKIDQIKEKFGGLRYYMTPSFDYDDERFTEMGWLVQKAEERSTETCEDCGEFGELRGGSWLRTLCDQCTAKP